MHFARTLETGAVPEWRSRYVEYSKGKSLIKKIDKASQAVRSPNWNLPPPAMEPSGDSSSTPDLPRPPQRAATFSTLAVNENSPLLDSTENLYQTPQGDTPGDTLPGSIPLQAIASFGGHQHAQRVAFYTWLNREVQKANSFFAEKEDEGAIKMRLIETQIRHFLQHKAEHRKMQSALGPQANSFFDRLDLPSLPAVFKGNVAGHKPRSISTAHVRDFANNDDHIGYYQAKTMLRVAMSEFYQFLQQLKGFRSLNESAVRKIVKKFDKQLRLHTLDKYLDEIKSLRLFSSNVLDELIHNTEDLFAKTFTKGNHKVAMEELSVISMGSEDPHNPEVLATGIFLGLSLPLVILALYTAIKHLPQHRWEYHFLLQIWGGFILVSGFLVGFGVNLAIWKYYRINYPFILEFNRANMLDYRQYTVLPSLLVFWLGLCGWLTFNTVQHFHIYYPCLFLGVSVVVFAFPYKYVWSSRKWLMHSLWRLVFSGLYPVEFRDLLMGDIMCSLANPLSNMEVFFCVYGTPHWWSGPGSAHAQRCTSSHSRALGFLNCLPGIWRFLQCWRRFGDTLDWFPHLLNAGKYTFTILYYMSLSLARISPHSSGLKAMFIVCALINGVYTAIWDVIMDFSLAPTAGMRSILVFPKWTYWIVVFLDPLMRQNWILYVVFWNQKNQGAKYSFIVALIEAVRRVMWVLFRVENEHAANIARCRAFKDLNMPYDDLEEAQNIENHTRRDAEQQGTALSPSGAVPAPTPPRRATTFPVHAPFMGTTSNPVTPLSVGMSPRIHFAHTNDFQRRKPKLFDHEGE